MSKAPPQPRTTVRKKQQTGLLIERELARAQARIQTVDLLTALLVLAAGLLGYLLVVMGLDMAVGLPGWLRTGLFLLALAGGGVYAVWALARPLLMKVNPYFAARRLEQSTPTSKNGLVNWLDLRGEKLNPVIQDSLQKNAARELGQADLEEAIPARRPLRLGFAAALLLLGLFGYFLFLPDHVASLMLRALVPFRSTVIPTFTRIELISPVEDPVQADPDSAEVITVEVLPGEPVTFAARVHGREPQQVVLEVQPTLREKPIRKPLNEPRADGAPNWQISLPSDAIPADGLWFRLTAGDGKTRQFRLLVSSKKPPSISEVEVSLEFPEYTGRRPHQQAFAPIKGILGTKARVAVVADQAVRDGTLVVMARNPDDQRMRPLVELPLRSDPASGDERRLVAVDAFELTKEMRDSAFYRLNLTNPDGKMGASPEYLIEVEDDRAPVVRIVSVGEDRFDGPQVPERLVLPANAVVSVEGKAWDDVAVNEVKLRLRRRDGHDLGLVGPKVVERQLQRATGFALPPADFQLTLDLAKLQERQGAAQGEPAEFVVFRGGELLELWVEATDEAKPEPNLGRSTLILIEVAAPQSQEQRQQQEEQAQDREEQAEQKKQERQEREEQQRQAQEQEEERQRQQQEKGGEGKPAEEGGEKPEEGKDQQQQQGQPGADQQKQEGMDPKQQQEKGQEGKPGEKPEEGKAQQQQPGQPGADQQKQEGMDPKQQQEKGQVGKPGEKPEEGKDQQQPGQPGADQQKQEGMDPKQQQEKGQEGKAGEKPEEGKAQQQQPGQPGAEQQKQEGMDPKQQQEKGQEGKPGEKPEEGKAQQQQPGADQQKQEGMDPKQQQEKGQEGKPGEKAEEGKDQKQQPGQPGADQQKQEGMDPKQQQEKGQEGKAGEKPEEGKAQQQQPGQPGADQQKQEGMDPKQQQEKGQEGKPGEKPEEGKAQQQQPGQPGAEQQKQEGMDPKQQQEKGQEGKAGEKPEEGKAQQQQGQPGADQQKQEGMDPKQQQEKGQEGKPGEKPEEGKAQQQQPGQPGADQQKQEGMDPKQQQEKGQEGKPGEKPGGEGAGEPGKAEEGKKTDKAQQEKGKEGDSPDQRGQQGDKSDRSDPSAPNEQKMKDLLDALQKPQDSDQGKGPEDGKTGGGDLGEMLPTPDKPDAAAARKATDLVLEDLRKQLESGKIDKRVEKALEDAKLTPQEAKALLNQMDRVRSETTGRTRGPDRSEQELRRGASLNRDTRHQPPPELERAYRRFTEERARQSQGGTPRDR